MQNVASYFWEDYSIELNSITIGRFYNINKRNKIIKKAVYPKSLLYVIQKPEYVCKRNLIK